MKYYIISGEASGDLHGSNLIKALKKEDGQAVFRAWGGDLMREAGADLVKHYKDLAFMGFAEVLMNLPTILGNIKFCKNDILEFQPDVVILIDYPGFNLRIAKFLKAKGIKVFYYISPQIWAWHQSRAHNIKKVVDKMFVILPFEQEFYKKFDMQVEYVGHPLLDAIEQRKQKSPEFIRKELGLENKPIVAILPGSRKQEIHKMLPLMMEMQEYFPQYQYTVAAAPSQDRSFYESLIGKRKIAFVANRTYDLLSISKAAMVTSGTATLETALFKVPEVVCYKGNFISYAIARQLVKLNFISLVNIVMGREIVKELIQSDFNKKLLREELGKLLQDQVYRGKMLANFDELRQKLGGGGASTLTAKKMVEYLT